MKHYFPTRDSVGNVETDPVFQPMENRIRFYIYALFGSELVKTEFHDNI